MDPLEPGSATHIASVRTDAAAISAVLRGHGGDAEVPHCPGWVVRDVVAHLGDVHRWATEIVRTGLEAADGHVAPTGDAALADWYDDAAHELCEVLTRTDPLTPCWTFGRPPAVAGLWRRRQALETAIHRVDVELAVGTAADLPLGLAVAGVTEVVDFLYPRQVHLRRTPAPAFMITVTADDTGDRWTVGESGPAATVTGSAEDLLLLLWRRPHGPVSRTGDPTALAAFAAAALVP